MNGKFFETHDNSSYEHMHNEYLNYPNFKKYIDENNNNNNFEESRKYIHREITKTLNANSIKIHRVSNEGHAQCNKSSKNMEQNKKKIMYNNVDDVEIKRNKNINNYTNIKCNNNIISSTHKSGDMKELVENTANNTNKRKSEINNERINKVSETCEKKNLLKHELFSDANKNIFVDKSSKKSKSIEHFIFINEEKLNNTRNIGQQSELQKNNSIEISEEFNPNIFSFNDLNNANRKTNYFNSIKIEDKKKKKEMDNKNFFINQSLENEHKENYSSCDNIKNKNISYVINNNKNMYNYDSNINIKNIQKKIFCDRNENSGSNRITNDPSKYKKYNNLKDNFFLNNSQRDFSSNFNILKNKSEVFLRTDIDEKIYANNIMYDDYFTIENLEKCDEKKEYFKREEYNNMKSEKNIGFNYHKNFDNSKILSNNKNIFNYKYNFDKRKYVGFIEKNNININNFNKEYLNDNNFNELSFQKTSNEPSNNRKEYFQDALDKNENSIFNEKLKENFSENNSRLLNNIQFVPCIYNNNNANIPIEQNESTTLMNCFLQENNLYNKNKNDLNLCDNFTLNSNILDLNDILNSNGYFDDSSKFERLELGTNDIDLEPKENNNNNLNYIEKKEEYVIKLFFGNLAPITTEKDMHNLFSNFGKCDSLIILKDRRSKSRGSGFVTFYNMQEAVNAIKCLNNKIILSGAHKPLEVRFPENKEEKKLRTKLLNAAKWKGKKIAPSGCLPVSTEDILNHTPLDMNMPSNFSFLNQNDSCFFSENDNASYDNKDINNYETSNINHFNYSEEFSELYKTTSETTVDTLNTDYFNKMEENKMNRYNSNKFMQENLSEDMNIHLMHKKYDNFLPNFLIDGIAGKGNSFETIGTVRHNNLDQENKTHLSNFTTIEINGTNSMSEMKSEPISSINDKNKNTNYNSVHNYKDDQNSYFFNFCNISDKEKTENLNDFCPYLDKKNNFPNRDEEYEHGFYNPCKKKNIVKNVLNDLDNDINDIVIKYDNMNNSNNNNVNNNNDNYNSCDNSEGYNNFNIHYLGFNLSHLIKTNEDGLLKNQNLSNVNSSNDELFNKEKKIDDYENDDQTNELFKLKITNPHSSIDLIEDHNINFETNDNLSDEMLKNLINLYTKNKSSIFTSHMFSYLNNVLCEINNALEIFSKFNVKTSLKNMNKNKKLNNEKEFT
ncbi:RNA-binding protein, putative [Plasmodium gallinaceum]|uniref:RNA-binding protein, putative n=1 Tax=Plasmodium gallinaceum TaxID=5849 RepID=A0A1J1GV65_PLAGA|nr:RNA-binding protein, putative [Plasmodium gallinaceum]CRG96441.1 RNA-binding protein, putative [Plasmodium gallinaceum]